MKRLPVHLGPTPGIPEGGAFSLPPQQISRRESHSVIDCT
jgi:hypothetical protein